MSDVIGSSGAAPGSYLDVLGIKTLFSEFNTWPVTNGSPAVNFSSIVDGGDLENTGIVSLLRRQYPVIYVFINTDDVLGDMSYYPYQGVDSTVCALFGIGYGPALKSTKIFETSEFNQVKNNFIQTYSNGGIPWSLNVHTIVKDNPFGIASYANGKKPVVLWMYNALNRTWYDQLKPSVQKYINPQPATGNFPTYETVFQNPSSLPGINELLMFTPAQVNLMANMWDYSLTYDLELKNALTGAFSQP